MLCQKCNTREANTHITQVINGKKTEMYLCRECANESQDFWNFGGKNFDNEFENLFSGLWNSPQFTMSKAQTLTTPKVCDICGTTTSEFLRSGKPSCSNCYTVFSDFLLRPLKQIHGSYKHNGKIPTRAGKDLKKADEIEKLQNKLNHAIAEQNFEDAAILRDKIRDLREQQ